jgi:hypothetical protein
MRIRLGISFSLIDPHTNKKRRRIKKAVPKKKAANNLKALQC